MDTIRGRLLRELLKKDSQQVLTGDNEATERWRGYFDQLFDLNHKDKLLDLYVHGRHCSYTSRIRLIEV